MRGEYCPGTNQGLSDIGSPPLARGILFSCSSVEIVRGITPACAGNTLTDEYKNLLAKDHPRLRGEYYVRLTHTTAELGSPPLARGILALVNLIHVNRGITPACAGNTLKKSLIYNLFPISISKFHLVSQTPEML